MCPYSSLKHHYLNPIFVIAALFHTACDWHPGKGAPNDIDLEATSVRFDPPDISVDDGVRFTLVFTNMGKDVIRAGSYDAALYIESQLLWSDNATARIEPGRWVKYGSAPGHFDWKPTEPGKYTYRFVLDENMRLDESDETNNVLSGELLVSPE